MAATSKDVNSLMKRRKYADVIQLLEAVPEQEREAGENWVMAQALCRKMDFLTPARRAELLEAKRLLELCRPEDQDGEQGALWQEEMGSVFFQLEEYQHCLEVLQDRTPFAGLVRSAGKRQQPTATFAVRTQRAWTAFVKREDDLYQLIHFKEGDSEGKMKFIRTMKGVLDKAFLDAYFSWETSDDAEVWLDTGNSRSVVLQGEFFIRHMPESVKKRWGFYSGITAAGPSEKEKLRSEYPGDIQVQICPLENGRFHLDLYHSKFDPDDEDTQNVEDDLSYVLGDGIKLMLIESTKIHFKELDGDFILLRTCHKITFQSQWRNCK